MIEHVLKSSGSFTTQPSRLLRTLAATDAISNVKVARPLQPGPADPSREHLSPLLSLTLQGQRPLLRTTWAAKTAARAAFSGHWSLVAGLYTVSLGVPITRDSEKKLVVFYQRSGFSWIEMVAQILQPHWG